jgi:hypothetical protein
MGEKRNAYRVLIGKPENLSGDGRVASCENVDSKSS